MYVVSIEEKTDVEIMRKCFIGIIVLIAKNNKTLFYESLGFNAGC